jgi:dolichol-phosphate mannosyltransferase
MRTIPDLTIVVPTFNERANIRPLVGLIDAALPGIAWEVLFVDDDSPDGTADEVRALGREDGRVRVLHRIGRRGLAGATIEGILSSIAPIVAVMDADLQHDETRLATMYAMLRDDPTLDIVIASRHAEGGSAAGGFSALRRRGSALATRLARRILKVTASDPMSGFFMLRRARFNEVVTQLQPEGFKLLLDMLSASRGRWRLAEVPYCFRARRHGTSKLDSAVTFEFFALIVARLSGGLVSIRFVLFGIVGLSGVVVQLGVMRLMLWLATDRFVIAQTAGVAVAMTTNFVFNNLLTYRDRALRGRAFLRGLLSFYAVCSVGAVANVGVAEAVFSVLPQPEIASASGALVGALWNFVASAVFTWRAR